MLHPSTFRRLTRVRGTSFNAITQYASHVLRDPTTPESTYIANQLDLDNLPSCGLLDMEDTSEI